MMVGAIHELPLPSIWRFELEKFGGVRLELTTNKITLVLQPLLARSE
jgi:hypothetical protein